MFRIRRIFDDLLPIDQDEIAQVQQVLRAQFPGVRPADVEALPGKLRNPMKYKFRSMLYVADEPHGSIRGFALVSHEPVLRFWYLDFIAATTRGVGGGVGGALLSRVREVARATQPIGLFFECPPDDAEEVAPDALKQNVARLRFYERFGITPLIDNAYRLPTAPGQRELPFLMFDDLGTGEPLRRSAVRAIVRAILERKYGELCSPAYVEAVVESFRADPVPRRPLRYVRAAPDARQRPPAAPCVALVVNDKHDIHHIRERGYVEAPARISAIREEIEPTGMFRVVAPREFADRHVTAVHDHGFVSYIEKACATLPPGKSVYPYVFPIRNQARPPKELTVRAGYYCIDTFTPLNRNAYPAARRAVNCVLTAAEEILRGERLAYALVRPPGHHAERRSYGGFCYFSNCAVAAQFLSAQGRVAILDVDYHHGNGQEEIFYERSDVLTVSIHGDPKFAYPYFSGFAHERGRGPGEGFNLNYPLPEKVDGPRYRRTLKEALERITTFAPRFLVVALGLDPAKGDPTGTWTFTAADFEENGRMIGRLRLPTLVVQEGGYRTRTLGVNVRRFFVGLVDGQFRESSGEKETRRE